MKEEPSSGSAVGGLERTDKWDSWDFLNADGKSPITPVETITEPQTPKPRASSMTQQAPQPKAKRPEPKAKSETITSRKRRHPEPILPKKPNRPPSASEYAAQSDRAPQPRRPPPGTEKKAMPKPKENDQTEDVKKKAEASSRYAQRSADATSSDYKCLRRPLPPPPMPPPPARSSHVLPFGNESLHPSFRTLEYQ